MNKSKGFTIWGKSTTKIKKNAPKISDYPIWNENFENLTQEQLELIRNISIYNEKKD